MPQHKHPPVDAPPRRTTRTRYIDDMDLYAAASEVDTICSEWLPIFSARDHTPNSAHTPDNDQPQISCADRALILHSTSPDIGDVTK